ncbi:MAG: hypothetical protein R3327_08205 [Nitrosopumilaceae archaeon]|nr:hypothetical protein [Nitrosopumilaceae archaeon]
MRREIREDIKKLQNEIISLEEKIIEQMRANYETGLRKSLVQLDSNLKYLSILANGAPIDKNEDRKIMEFLRIHYENLRKLSLPA